MTDNLIHSILYISAKTKTQTADTCVADAEQAAQTIAQSLKQGKKVMLCGNGGSAGDAQHLAAEFVATLDHTQPRPGLAALALTTDTSFLTAYSNDFGFEGVFQRQVQALGCAGDVLWVFSTSGNSVNIMKAVEQARMQNIHVIAMTGETGGQLAGVCDVLIRVPSAVTMHIQECHIALGHAITARVESLLGYANKA